MAGTSTKKLLKKNQMNRKSGSGMKKGYPKKKTSSAGGGSMSKGNTALKILKKKPMGGKGVSTKMSKPTGKKDMPKYYKKKKTGDGKSPITSNAPSRDTLNLKLKKKGMKAGKKAPYRNVRSR